MSYPSSDQISYSFYNHIYVNAVGEVTNPQVGYNWYQSPRSSDTTVMNLGETTPCYPPAYSFPQHQVSNPGMYYSQEYEPPPIFRSKSYASDLCAYQMFDISSEREFVFADKIFDTNRIIASPYTLTCHTLSTGQLYYALESTSPLTTPCSTVASSSELISVHNYHESGKEFTYINEVVNSVSVLAETDGYKECGSGSDKGMGGQDEGGELRGNFLETNITLGEVVKADNIEKRGVKSGVKNDIDDVIGDGSLTDLFGAVISSDKLTNKFDDSVVLDSLLIYQSSSSITEYVEDFIHVKNRAEFIFKREFDDDLLSYCFVEGLKEKLRDDLELWAPKTLQEAIYLAKFQESLLEEILLVEAIQMKSDKEQKELELQVGTRIHTNNCINVLSGEIFRGKCGIILASINDSQKRATTDVGVISNLEVAQAVAISINSDKWSSCAHEIHRGEKQIVIEGIISKIKEVFEAFSCKEVKNDVLIIPARLMHNDSSGKEVVLLDLYSNTRMRRDVEEIFFQKGEIKYTWSIVTAQYVLGMDFGGVTSVLKKMQSDGAKKAEKILVNINSVLDSYRVACTMFKAMLRLIILIEGEQDGMLLNFFCCSEHSYRVMMWSDDPLEKEILLRQDGEWEMHPVACEPMIEYLCNNGEDVHDLIATSELILVLKWEKCTITPTKEECFWKAILTFQHQKLDKSIKRDIVHLYIDRDSKSNMVKLYAYGIMLLELLVVTVVEAYYPDWIKLFEAFFRFTTVVEILYVEPVIPVSENSNMWWCYSAKADSKKKILRYRLYRKLVQFRYQLHKQLELENKQAKELSFTIYEDLLDQVNQMVSFSQNILKIKQTVVIVKDEIVFGDILLRIEDLKSSVDKETEGISGCESLQADGSFSFGTLEESETLFLFVYKIFSFVLYKSDNAAGVVVTWFSNDIVLVFDPGGIINHVDLHTENILICEGSGFTLLGNREVTNMLEQ